MRSEAAGLADLGRREAAAALAAGDVDRIYSVVTDHGHDWKLHLRPGVREEFLPWLETEHPDLVERYLQMDEQPYGPKAMRESLGRQVSSLVADVGGVRRGVEPARRFFRRDRERVQERTPEQLRLL